MTPGPGIEPGTHWWKASALTTAPTLLPKLSFTIFKSDKKCVFPFIKPLTARGALYFIPKVLIDNAL